MIGHGEKLSRKREQALYSLVHQPTIVAAARDIGIGEATLRRWLKNPVFRSEYRRYKQEIFEHSIALLQVSGDEAVKTLLSSLHAESESEYAKELFRASLCAAFTPQELKRLAAEVGMTNAEVVIDTDRHMSLQIPAKVY